MKKALMTFLGIGSFLLGLSGGAWALSVASLPRDGQTPQGRAGEALAVKDITGDGIPDLIIGAPRYGAGDPPGLNQNAYIPGEVSDALSGDVLIFKGTASGPEATPFITLIGTESSDRFGAAISVGDITGDGKNDLIISAIRASGSDAPRSGCVYVFRGSDISIGGTFDASTAVSHFCGRQYNELFGHSLAVGQFDGEAGLDVAVGAPWHSPFQAGMDKAQASHKYMAGGVYLISGAEIAAQIAAPTHKIAAHVSPGDGGAAVYGQYILNLGDLDSTIPSKDELLIFATGAGGHGHRAPGQVYLSTWNSADGFSTPLVVVNGTGQLARYKPAFVGDINGDGFQDIGVSSSTGRGTPSGADTNRAGGIYIINGNLLGPGIVPYKTVNPDGTITETTNSLGNVALGAVTGAESRDYFGTSISGAGDVNGDGVADIAVGAPWANGRVITAIGGTAINDISGSVYLISGKSIMDAVGDEKFKFKVRGPGPQGFLLEEIAGTSNDRFGEVLAQGDLTPSVTVDVVVGAPDHDPPTSSNISDVPGTFSNDNRGTAFIITTTP
ncbi:MAG: hypothetical protein ACE5FZ_08815 [Nitrospiria bacterium]